MRASPIIIGLLVVLFAGAFFLLSAFTNIFAKDSEMARFEWTATNSAPKAYPIELLRADLILADGSGYYVPDRRVIHHGWGKPGATHLVGEAEKALPAKLSATWFSYVENKFYDIETELPTEVFLAFANQRIESPQRGAEHDFDRMVFGFGPEGEGAIWFSAHSNMIDVFRFKGTETQTDWTELIDNPEVSRTEFIDVILEEALGQQGAENAKINGYQLGAWPRQQQRWNWGLTVSGAAQTSLLKFSSLNGEVFHFFDDLEPNIEHSQYGAPSEILIHWESAANQARSATLTFDANETLEAFEEFAATGDKITLHIELSESARAVAVSLETPDLIYEFEKVQSEIYSRD